MAAVLLPLPKSAEQKGSVPELPEASACTLSAATPGRDCPWQIRHEMEHPPLLAVSLNVEAA